MGFRGGDLKQLLIGGREVTPVAEGDFSFALGGIEAEAHLAGNGVSYLTGNKSPAYFKGPVLGDASTGLLEYLQRLEDAGETVPISFTRMSGYTYSGSLFVVGKLEEKRDGSIDLDLEGGKLEKI
jgi:hypothetical protein